MKTTESKTQSVNHRISRDQSETVGISWNSQTQSETVGIGRQQSGSVRNSRDRLVTIRISLDQSGWVGNSQDQPRSGGRVGSVRIISLDVLRCLIYAVIYFLNDNENHFQRN